MRRKRAHFDRVAAEEAARERWFDVPGPVCRSCGAEPDEAFLEAHHVVEKSWLKRHGLHHLLWDTRNRMLLCRKQCHDQHTGGSRRLPFSLLSDENREFVAELEALVPPVPIRGHMRRYIGYEMEEAA